MATHPHWSATPNAPVTWVVTETAGVAISAAAQPTPAFVWAWIYQADRYEDPITKLFAEESDARSHALRYAKDNADEWDGDEVEDDQEESFYSDASFYCLKRMKVKRS